MKFIPRSWIRSALLVLGSAASVFLFMGSSKPTVNTPGWRLVQLADRLQAQGLELRVIASRRDGLLGNNAYLTENPDETWLSFQLKVKSQDRIASWRGSVWVVWNDRYEQALIQVVVPSSGRYGRQIGEFFVFGDDQLIERIQRALR